MAKVYHPDGKQQNKETSQFVTLQEALSHLREVIDDRNVYDESLHGQEAEHEEARRDEERKQDDN